MSRSAQLRAAGGPPPADPGGDTRPPRAARTSLMLISASTYCSPFCRMEMRAAGGTRVPLMFDWLMWLSIPNVNAEWEKPAVRGKPGLCGRAEGCARPRGPGAAPRAGPPAPGLGGAGRAKWGPRDAPAAGDGNAASRVEPCLRY